MQLHVEKAVNQVGSRHESRIKKDFEIQPFSLHNFIILKQILLSAMSTGPKIFALGCLRRNLIFLISFVYFLYQDRKDNQKNISYRMLI